MLYYVLWIVICVVRCVLCSSMCSKMWNKICRTVWLHRLRAVVAKRSDSCGHLLHFPCKALLAWILLQIEHLEYGAEVNMGKLGIYLQSKSKRVKVWRRAGLKSVKDLLQSPLCLNTFANWGSRIRSRSERSERIVISTWCGTLIPSKARWSQISDWRFYNGRPSCLDLGLRHLYDIS